MKIRSDFVTNSSSVVFILIKNNTNELKTVQDFIKEFPSMHEPLVEYKDLKIYPNSTREIKVGDDDEDYEEDVKPKSPIFDVNFKYIDRDEFYFLCG